MNEFKYNASMLHEIALKKKADDQAAIHRCAARLAENILEAAHVKAKEGGLSYLLYSIPKMQDPITNIVAIPEWKVSIVNDALKILQSLGFKAEKIIDRQQEISSINVDWSSPLRPK